MNCTSCHKTISTLQGIPAFCPWCGCALERDERAELECMLDAIRAEQEPVRRHELIMEAEARFPDAIEPRQERLYLGRMWERGGKPDFYRIPFWPLNAIERPGQFPARERRRMLETFFHNPEVDEVSLLAPDRDAFYDDYYGTMAEKYVELFIKNSNANSFFLGFRRSAKDSLRRCAECVAAMLKNLAASAEIDEKAKLSLGRGLIKGFETVFGGNAAEYTSALEELLPAADNKTED